MTALSSPKTETIVGTTQGRPPRRQRGTLSNVLIVNALLVLGCAYTVLPVLWLVFASTKSATELYGQNVLSFGTGLLSNIGEVLTADGGVFLRWMLNSFLYAGVGAVVGGFISLLAGYAFDKFSFHGKKGLYAFVLVGVLIPNTATVLPMYLLASTVGMTNTIWAILIPSLCNPFSVYLARIFSAGYVPDQTLEAARVDGAGHVSSFFAIAMPMLKPGFVTIALFQFVAVWNNFMLPLVMVQDRHLFPISLGMYMWQGMTKPQPEYISMVITGSALSIIPLIIAFVLLQRFWKAGLTAGSVK